MLNRRWSTHEAACRQLEWPVNCFLKALEGIPYSRQLESAKLYRNDAQVIIRHVTISQDMLVGIVACWNASSTAS